MLLKAGISKTARFSPSLQRDGAAIAHVEGREESWLSNVHLAGHRKSNASSLLDRWTTSAGMCGADSLCGWVENSSLDNKGVVCSPNVCRAESQNCVWEGVTNSMRKSCGDQGKQAHVHGRKEREGGESGTVGRRAQKDTGPLFVLTKIDLGPTRIYKSDNQQKTF